MDETKQERLKAKGWEVGTVTEFLELTPGEAALIEITSDSPARRFWVDYDKEADVLYVSLRRPQKATNTRMADDGILLRYQGEQLVGVTVLDASARS